MPTRPKTKRPQPEPVPAVTASPAGREPEGNGKLTIGRTGSNRGDDHVTIRLEDRPSSFEVVEIRVNLAEFADALMGRGYVSCNYKLNPSPNIGKRGEHKTEKVLIPDRAYGEDEDRAATIRRAIEPFEVDGWSGRDEDADNHHRWTDRGEGGIWTQIVFERWIDDDPAPKGGD
jgi:hypothetical protein